MNAFRSRHKPKLQTRHGYTLLEVFLVLVITGVLIAAIASALNIHLRVAEVGRAEVEQAQLARALLRRIADDLRGAVPHVEPVASSAGSTDDAIAVAAASTTSTSGGVSSGSTGGAAPSSGSTGGTSSNSSGASGVQTLQPLKTLTTLSTLKPNSASSSTTATSGSISTSGSTSGKNSSGNSTETSAAETEAEPSTIKPPGIYGDQFSLQVDVSRLPSANGSATNLAGAATDAPGDVKTVGYFLSLSPAGTSGSAASGTTAMTGMGLYRQSSDRAAASYGSASGGAVGTGNAQLLAAEVAAIEFRYYDGTQWQTVWDSSGGTLPTAVEILLTLHPPEMPAVSSSSMLTQPQTYRSVVSIPAARASASSSSTGTDSSQSSSVETTK
ncbi:MAG: GspJ family type II secretion system protein [Planctomycetia bacterium]|nr:GspJ family type II secretion system protein [Planctomycetia bacterium]